MSTDELFRQVSRNLAHMGCMPLSDYLQGPHPPPRPHSIACPSPSKPAVDTLAVNAISRLHQACQRVLSSSDPLKFEFVEQDGPRSKKCILTISHPNGCTRSYATDPAYARKADAKAAAASLAIDMGALDFITHGSPHESNLRRGLVLASIKNSLPPPSDTPASDCLLPEPHTIDPVKQIEDCCLEWRTNCPSPNWVALLEPKLGRTQGCALSIELSPHVAKVYASDPIHVTYSQAKFACAEAALREGVLEFIQHGNGQLCPAPPQLFLPHTSFHINPVSLNKQPPMSLQAFYDSLPRPFPEPFEGKDANAIGAPGYMNSLVQNARGGKLTILFFYTSDGTPGLHGCFLRLGRHEEYRAYLVKPRFSKRADAKAAVCLQALSCGAGDYVRAIGKAVEAKVTPLMKTRVNDQVYPVLLSEYSKVSSSHPHFSYEKEQDAFGCTMTLQLGDDPAPEDIRKWTTPNEYRNKADARVAVICTAVEQGAIDFIRFRGKSPPVGHASLRTLQNYVSESSIKSNGKREMADLPAEPEKPVKRHKKTKLEGVQCSDEQPNPSDVHGRNYGNRNGGCHGDFYLDGVGAGEGLYQPGLGRNSGSGSGSGHFGMLMNGSGTISPLYGYTPLMQPYGAVFPSPHPYGRMGPEPGEVFDASQERGSLCSARRSNDGGRTLYR